MDGGISHEWCDLGKAVAYGDMGYAGFHKIKNGKAFLLIPQTPICPFPGVLSPK